VFTPHYFLHGIIGLLVLLVEDEAQVEVNLSSLVLARGLKPREGLLALATLIVRKFILLVFIAETFC
jgi:hypothetical protein